MQKRILRKGLVLGILILFVGASIIPSITGTIVEKQIPKENKSSLMGFNPRGTTWYVDDDNTMGPWDGTQEHPFQYIQDGINAANNGDTVFVYNGTYYDNLEIINKSISVIGENKETTIIDANWSSYGLIICADSCTIEGFTFRNGEPGIHLAADSQYNISCSNNIIRNNIIQNNSRGIYVLVNIGVSSNNVFSENILTNNGMYGICIHGVRGPSHNNSIIGNTITNHSTGVDIRKSTGNNTISNNIITGYSEGIRIHTGGNWNIIHGNVIPNTNDCQYPSFRGIELFYIFDTNISSNYIETINGGILISNGNNNSISENTLLGIGDDGICIFDSYDSNISWNVITNFDRGIYLSDSYNFSIYMNNISNCNIPIYIVGGGQTQGNLLFINARSSDSQNIIKRNNFLHNKFPAIFIFRGVVLGIIWRENYWGRPRLLPKIIIGFKMFAEVLPIPARVQFDWHPAKKPYDIPRVAI